MKTSVKYFLQFLGIPLFLLLTACNKDDDDNNRDIDNKGMTAKEVMEEEAEYSHMNEAVEESGQSGLYSNTNTNMTVFVANNAAFEDLFVEVDVSSISELEAKMGEKAFARMVRYHAINGRFHIADFHSGSEPTFAAAENEEMLTVHISRESNSHITLNGNDERGASTTGTATREASNGNIIEINAVVRPQTNYENIEDAEEDEGTHFFVDIMSGAEASAIADLQNEASSTTVLVANDAQAEQVLNAYMASIVTVSDLEAMLDASAKNVLYSKYGVSTMVELRQVITIEDIADATASTTAEVIAQLSAGSRAAFMAHLIFDSNVHFAKRAMDNATVTSEAGVTYEVSSTSEGALTLTDNEQNELVLSGRSARSINGSVYSISEVR